MAAKGTEAKAYAIEKIKEAFGTNFVGEYDKKLYVNCPEAGGMVQIAIALTCPKIPVAVAAGSASVGAAVPASKNGGMNFEDMVVVSAPTTELTQAEKDNIQHLLAMVT